MTQSLDEFDEVFTALADPNRRTVLDRLALSGEGTATTIAEVLPISRQAVVKHLAHLDRAKLVQARRRGREVRYSLQPRRLAATAQEIGAIADCWDRTLVSLKRIAEDTEPPGG
jgi:DNA-binding transcriptional ArsR family regulator